MSEEQLATEQSTTLQSQLIASRRKYLWLGVVFAVASVGIAFSGFWMIALCSLMLTAIFISQYFDANSHLHEVQRRSTKNLIPDFSKFGPAATGSEALKTAAQRPTT